MYFIGVDLGTSAVKLLLMEESGKICNIVSKEYPLFFPHPGWSEQNPEDWYTQSMAGMKELTEGIDRSQVAGISFGGQMHGLVTLDDQDQVIRPAILWNDGRTSEETDYLNNVIGKDKLSQYTANIAFAGFTAPKILWMKKNEPEKFAKVVKIMLPKDYLAYRLSGSFCTDGSDASGVSVDLSGGGCAVYGTARWKKGTVTQSSDRSSGDASGGSCESCIQSCGSDDSYISSYRQSADAGEYLLWDGGRNHAWSRAAVVYLL